MSAIPPKQTFFSTLRGVLCIIVGGLAIGGNAFGEEQERERPPRERDERPKGRPGGPEGGFGEMLKRWDQDGDHALSLAEFSASERVRRLPDDVRAKLFARLDKNADGKLTKEDLPPKWEDRRKHHRGDADHNGEITFEEFQNSGRVEHLPVERQREVFDKLDRNHDGVLNAGDWKGGRDRPHGRGGDHRPPQDLDSDGDGKISFEEFRKHPRQAEASEDEQEDRFEALDKNEDGFLDATERTSPPPKKHRPDQRKTERTRKRGA